MTSGQSEASEQIMTTPTTRRTLTKDDKPGVYRVRHDGCEMLGDWDGRRISVRWGCLFGESVEVLAGPLISRSEWDEHMKGIATTTTLECGKTYLCSKGLVATIQPNELARLREIESAAKEYFAADGHANALARLGRALNPPAPFTPPPKPELRLWRDKNGRAFWGVSDYSDRCVEIDSTGKPLEKQA